jgi:nitrogen fixation NifU-like protein
MSMLSDELVGKTIKEVEALKPKAVLELLNVNVGPRRLKCALLCLHAVKNARRAMEGMKPQSWAETMNGDQ